MRERNRKHCLEYQINAKIIILLLTFSRIVSCACLLPICLHSNFLFKTYSGYDQSQIFEEEAEFFHDFSKFSCPRLSSIRQDSSLCFLGSHSARLTRSDEVVTLLFSLMTSLHTWPHTRTSSNNLLVGDQYAHISCAITIWPDQPASFGISESSPILISGNAFR